MIARIAVGIVFLAVVLGLFIIPVRFEGAVTARSSRVFESIIFRYEILRYPARVVVVYPDSSVPIGLATDTGFFNFGVLPTDGADATRYLNITNDKSHAIKVTMEAYGPIAPLMVFPEPQRVLLPGETVTIPIRVVSENDIGNFTGDVTITTAIPKNSVGDFLVTL